MANMSYCRFENTATDLQDCLDNWNEDADLSEYEQRARKRIMRLCREIIDWYGDEDDEATE